MDPFSQQFTNNFVALGAAVFALGLGFFSLVYLSRRRKMLHQERMASLIKGLHYAGVAQDVFGKAKTDVRNHLLLGLRWLLGGAGLAGAIFGYGMMQPSGNGLDASNGVFAGAIPASIGLAHLIFYFLSNRRQTAQSVQAVFRPGSYRSLYRPGTR